MDGLTHKLKNRFGLGGSSNSGHSDHSRPSQPHYPPTNQVYEQHSSYPQPQHSGTSSNYGQPGAPYAGQADGFIFVSETAPPQPSHGGYYAPQPTRPSDNTGWEDISYAPSSSGGLSGRETPPPIPPRLHSDTRPDRPSSTATASAIFAGAIYEPGTYPTPDLFPFPLSKHKTLSDPPAHTSAAIQDALNELGPHSTLYLPPRTRWSVSSTITLHPHQELATLGYPGGEDEIAWLEAEEECTGHVLNGADMAGVRLRNIGIDGGREKHGKCIPSSGPSTLR